MSVITKYTMMNILITRLHSSRMHTARSCSRLGGGVVCSGAGVPGPVRGVPGPVGSLLVGGGVCSWVVPGTGGSLLLGGGIPACTDADPPCGQNDRHV